MTEGIAPAGSPPAAGPASEQSARSHARKQAGREPFAGGRAPGQAAHAQAEPPDTGRERETERDHRPEPPPAVPLLEPRDGLPPLVATAPAFAAAVATLRMGEGPVAVDAERASGYRYGHRAFLVQLRRRGAGTVLIDPVACPDLSALDAALAGCEAVLHAASQDQPIQAELG
jgi:ribonuclease D